MRVVFDRRLFTYSGLLTQRMEVARPIRPGARSPRPSPGQELRLGRNWAVRYSIWWMRRWWVSALMEVGWGTGLIAACPLAVCQAALGGSLAAFPERWGLAGHLLAWSLLPHLSERSRAMQRVLCLAANITARNSAPYATA